jgi:hypothetical protein
MRKLIVPIMAGALLITSVLPLAVEARRGGGGQGGGFASQNGIQNQDRARLRDGSCLNSTTQAGPGLRKGKGYGPGDGTGNTGAGPKDGTGYGAPSQR